MAVHSLALSGHCLLNNTNFWSSLETPETAVDVVDLDVTDIEAIEQPHERTVNELLETLTREGQWTATPNRAVRSELPRDSEVYYQPHESLHVSLTVPRHGIRNVTSGDTKSYSYE